MQTYKHCQRCGNDKKDDPASWCKVCISRLHIPMNDRDVAATLDPRVKDPTFSHWRDRLEEE